MAAKKKSGAETPADNDAARAELCRQRKERPKHPTWGGRFRLYPWSCAGHIAQGFAAGVLAATGHYWPASVWGAGFVAYQGLSFARKVNTEGRGDTAGLDAADFVVGAIPGYIIGIAVQVAIVLL